MLSDNATTDVSEQDMERLFEEMCALLHKRYGKQAYESYAKSLAAIYDDPELAKAQLRRLTAFIHGLALDSDTRLCYVDNIALLLRQGLLVAAADPDECKQP